METAASFEVRNAPSSYPTVVEDGVEYGLQILEAFDHVLGRAGSDPSTVSLDR
jgi:hypothetical protein